MPKRDPYRNDPKARVEHLKHVQEMIRTKKPTVWKCVCGNEATSKNIYTGFDYDGWQGVLTCGICRRNMKREEVNDA